MPTDMRLVDTYKTKGSVLLAPDSDKTLDAPGQEISCCYVEHENQSPRTNYLLDTHISGFP